ncbi:MAG: rRNA methyltransferase [Deltaproteobacteria bacterium]|nr:MAG: rRNA methyltransferase [Deltaproteobacteria bacterium]
MSSEKRSDRLIQMWIRLLNRLAWPIVIIAVLLAGLSIYYTVQNLTFQTTRSGLIGGNQHLINLKEQLEQEFGERDGLVAVISNHDPKQSIAFAQALDQELRQYPEEFSERFYHLNPEHFKSWALLYMKPEQIGELKDKLLESRRVLTALAAEPSLTQFFTAINEEITRDMLGQLFTEFLQEEKAKLPDLSLFNATLREFYHSLEDGSPYQSPLRAVFPKEFGDWQEEGYFFTKGDKYLLFLITTNARDYTESTKILNHLRQIVEQVKTRFPDIQVGVTGPEALESDEMTDSLQDITLATWLSLLGQFSLLILFFRSLKRPLMEVVVLLVGLSWTFGLTTLVIGHLNILSMVFAPLMMGITIDYGIHWFCHLEEEENGSRRCTLRALWGTQKYGTPGIIYAALATTVSFIPLIFTGFQGLAELGLILFMGIPAMLTVTLLVQPALVFLIEKCRPEERGEVIEAHPHPFMSLKWQRPGLILGLGLAFAALGGVSLWFVPFDLNPLNLQNQATESVVWEHKILEDSQYSSVYGVMTVCCPEEIQARTQALKQLPTVSHVESILSFLPRDPEYKQHLLQELRPVLDEVEFPASLPRSSSPAELASVLGRIHFKLSQAQNSNWQPENQDTEDQLDEANLLLSQLLTLLRHNPDKPIATRLAKFEQHFFADLKDKWQLLNSSLNTPPPQISDLPQEVRERFIGSQGSYLIRVFPAQDVWDREPLAKFVHDLRTVDPNVVGDPVLLYVFTSAFRNACLAAAGLALLAVTGVLLLFFRNIKLALLAIVPLLVGTGWSLNLMWLLDISFNQANVLFLPLILGEGMEYGIVILSRWKIDPMARGITLPASTAKGVTLSALTTAVGFGSLMVSSHQGVFSLGLLATVGSTSVLLAALSVLPAFLRLLSRKEAHTRAVLEPLTQGQDIRPFQ